MFDHYKHAKSKSPEEYGKQRGFAVRDLETIVPILATVEELNLEIQALDTSCLLLVRWIRAVLNVRETRHRKASISLRAGVQNHSPPRIGNPMKEICRETARITTRDGSSEEIWLLKRRKRDSSVGPSFGVAWRGRHAVQAEVPDPLPCDVAWRDLIQYGSIGRIAI